MLVKGTPDIKLSFEKVPLYLILIGDLCGVKCICIILACHTGSKLYNELTDIEIFLDMPYIFSCDQAAL